MKNFIFNEAMNLSLVVDLNLEVCRETVKHIKLRPRMTVNELVLEMSNSGCFGAGRLAQAVDIYERMIKSNAVIILGLAGAMVPSGMKQTIVEMIKRKMVHIIVSTGANMVHDALEAFGGVHYKGTVNVDDKLLYKHGIDRVYDVFIPEEDFRKNFDRPLIEIFNEILRENGDKTFSTAEFMEEVGKRLKDENSILYNAYKYKVPIFVPAIQDSCYGLAVEEYVTKHGGKNIKVDSFKGVIHFFEIIKKAEKKGALLIGGGVPKNFVFQAAFKANKPYDYVIQITMDRPEPGGLSGATLEEAISWGKVKGEADRVQVICDATICLPIIVAAVMERLFEK